MAETPLKGFLQDALNADKWKMTRPLFVKDMAVIVEQGTRSLLMMAAAMVFMGEQARILNRRSDWMTAIVMSIRSLFSFLFFFSNVRPKIIHKSDEQHPCAFCGTMTSERRGQSISLSSQSA